MKKKSNKRKNSTNSTKDKQKIKINKQKLFIFISSIFIIICILWYGSRAIYYYLDTRKKVKNEDKFLAQTIIDKNYNTDNFKKINNDYYFYKDAKNNYLSYSNMLWRIVKVNKDNQITLILDNPITYLANGKGKDFKSSYITKWLNKKESTSSTSTTSSDNSTKNKTGILENNLNNKQKYLMKTTTCIDNIKNIKSATCNKTSNDNYLSLLSVIDYINTGAEDSFINNGYYSYLANNKNKDVWYITDDGKLDTSDGEDIYSVKPVITIKANVSVISGKGSKKTPYIIEDDKSYFASYVKLDDDLYRVYDSNDDYVKLVANDYLKVDDEYLEYNYSSKNYLYNDKVSKSLAYYLNRIYINKLSYKNLIVTNNYSNSYYGEDNKFNYQLTLNNSLSTKIAIPSIGDAVVNKLSNYSTTTGIEEDSDEIYTISKDGTLDQIDIQDKTYVLPCITIAKENLKAGQGSIDDPYRTE